MENKKIIEGLLYIRGSEGIDPKTLKILLGINTVEARKLLKNFLNDFNSQDRGIRTVVYKDIFKFTTLPEHKNIISDLVTIESKRKLSESAIETIGIVAYKQPVTRTQISNIRGVISDGVMNTLLQKGLIKEVGVRNTPGNPILYGITDKFYDYFQISSLKELPTLDEFDREDENEEPREFDLFSSQRVEMKKEKKEINTWKKHLEFKN